MPITTTIDHDRELTIHAVVGYTSFEEEMATLKQFWEGQPTRSELWDFNKACVSRLPYDEIYQQ